MEQGELACGFLCGEWELRGWPQMCIRDRLDDLITQQRQKIKDCELKVKQAQLDLEKSKLALNNSTVCSTIDGVVRTLTDADTATQTGQPFLVVSGQDQFLLSLIHI